MTERSRNYNTAQGVELSGSGLIWILVKIHVISSLKHISNDEHGWCEWRWRVTALKGTSVLMPGLGGSERVLGGEQRLSCPWWRGDTETCLHGTRSSHASIQGERFQFQQTGKLRSLVTTGERKWQMTETLLAEGSSLTAISVNKKSLSWDQRFLSFLHSFAPHLLNTYYVIIISN